MDVPGMSPRNGRRRRALIDESRADVVVRRARPRTRAARRRTGRYKADTVQQLPTLLDLIPRAPWCLGLLLALGIVGLALVLTLHQQRPRLQSWWHVSLDLLDATASHGLVAHLSCICLMLASAYCLLIYSIRRHRTDDYRGRYRLWLWLSAWSIIASFDCGTGLHRLTADVIRQMVSMHVPTALAASAAYWICGLALSRSMISEMWESRGTRGAIAAAVLAYASSTVIGLSQLSDQASLWASTTWLAGHWMVLMGCLAYARHVVREANGELAAAQRKKIEPVVVVAPNDPAVASETSSDPESPVSLEIDTERQVVEEWEEDSDREREVSPSSVRFNRPATHRDEDEGEDEEDDDSESPVSRAERKRLRKLKRRERRAA